MEEYFWQKTFYTWTIVLFGPSAKTPVKSTCEGDGIARKQKDGGGEISIVLGWVYWEQAEPHLLCRHLRGLFQSPGRELAVCQAKWSGIWGQYVCPGLIDK